MQDYKDYKWALFEKGVVLFMNLIFSRCTFVQEGRYIKFSNKYGNFWGNKSGSNGIDLTAGNFNLNK